MGGIETCVLAQQVHAHHQVSVFSLIPLHVILLVFPSMPTPPQILPLAHTQGNSQWGQLICQPACFQNMGSYQSTAGRSMWSPGEYEHSLSQHERLALNQCRQGHLTASLCRSLIYFCIIYLSHKPVRRPF